MVQQRKKIRFNFIDIMIVLLILAVIGTAVYLIMSDFRPKNKLIANGNVTYCVRISGVDKEMVSLIQPEQEVKDSITGQKIGVIEGIDRSPITKYYGNTAVLNEDGVYVVPSQAYENKYDIKVYIKVDAEKDERGIYSVAGNRLLIGSPIYFKIPSFASVSYITEVRENPPMN